MANKINFSKHPLKLNNSERFLIARCIDPRGYPVELGVTVSYTVQVPPSFDVSHETRNDNADVFYTTDAREALLVYNSIVQGE